MLDSLKGSFLIHKISYIWNLSAALESYDIKKVKRTAKEYVDLLDYEKVCSLFNTLFTIAPVCAVMVIILLK